MNRPALWVAAGLIALGGAGAALMLWNRAQDRRPTSKRTAERLLIGFQPRTVKRVRFRVGAHEVDLERRPTGWEPTWGGAVAGVRVDVLLDRLATVKVRRVKGRGRRRGRPPGGKAAAEVRVWRGSARILVVRLYRRGGGLLLTTSDRPGVYRARPGLLSLLEREVGRPALASALALDPAHLASVELQSGGRVMLIQRNGRWFVEENAALAPADSEAVGRLIRGLQQLRITQRVAKGAGALAKHGLDRPALQIKVDDGTRRTLRLGGKCPRGKGDVLAAVGKTEVVCVTSLDAKALAGPFLDNRLFSAAADEIKAASVTRGKRTLAVVNRPAGGGWTMISPSLDKVDQAAATGFVAQLSQLRGRTPPANATAPPAKARRVGEVRLTPLVGRDERVELWAPRSGTPLWVRRVGGSRWFTLGPEATAWAAADPVVLRSRAVCTAPDGGILRLLKTGAAPVTEVVTKEGPSWQLTLLRGRPAPRKAYRIAASLEAYRPKANKNATTEVVDQGWKKPVLLVGPTDRVVFGSLLHLLTRVRAQRFVAGGARARHGLGKGASHVTYVYEHGCVRKDGARKCQQTTCALDLGVKAPGGGCYARRRGERDVFVAGAALCRASRLPLASRQAVRLTMPRLSVITLRAEGKTQRVERAGAAGWKRPPGIAPVKWEAGATALLALAPLTTLRVAGYGGPKLGKPRVTVVLRAEQVPPIELRFYASKEPDAKHAWLLRKGLPTRYRVERRTVDALVRLATGR